MTITQEYNEKHHLATKIYAVDILGGQCVMCGQNNIFALEFDHIKPTRQSRRPQLGRSLSRRSAENTAIRIVNGTEDLTNLQVLCGSCHLIKTYYEGNHGNITIRSLNKNPAQEVK